MKTTTTTNKYATVLSLIPQLLAAQKATRVGIHQLVRNILPMHKLVIIALMMGDSNAVEPKIGLAMDEIYNIIVSLGQRVTKTQLSVTLYAMRKAGVIEAYVSPDWDSSVYFYATVGKLHLTDRMSK